MDIQNQIRSVISNITSNPNEANEMNGTAVMDQLRQRGVVDEIMRHIQVDGTQGVKPATHFTNSHNADNQLSSKKGNTVYPVLFAVILFSCLRDFLNSRIKE